MDSQREREKNQRAYRRLKQHIHTEYPAGRFVAIADGRIVADAATFDELDAMLERLGKNSHQALVAQAGLDYPDNVTIF